MPRYTRLETLNSIHQVGLVVVFYHSDPETVINVATACAEGGARLFEFTHRGDFAQEVFADLEKHCRKQLPQLITGVGSIVDPETAALYINQGANFVVGPVFNPDVAKTCNRRKVPYSPGCGSASEISAAEELGCEIIKVFPGGQVGGPEFVKAMRGPCPWVSLMPTGGVEPTEESLTAWFQSGIVAAGIGSKLIPENLLAANDYQGITSRVRQAIDLIAKIRAKKKQ